MTYKSTSAFGLTNRIARARDDRYLTPHIAIEKLISLDLFKNGETFHEPGCGDCRITKALRIKYPNSNIVPSDIRYFSEYKPFAKVKDVTDYSILIMDFVNGIIKSGHPFIDNVVTNPPFLLAEEFLQNALIISRKKVVLFLRLAFLESQKRAWVEQTPLEKVWIFRNRINAEKAGSFNNSKMLCFAWFVWNKEYDGEPKIGWL